VRTARVLAWGEMARQVAHEIKNPLTPIKLAVQHVRRAYADKRVDFEDILYRNVEAILREIDRLGEIARAFSRFGTPALASTPLEPVDVGHAIRETLALYGGSGDLVFEEDIPAEALPLATARATELKEVLVNLLENSREAIDGPGRITISARPGDDPGYISLRVVDNGVGIPANQIERIFEPHFSTRSSGTGLGLAIVKRIVDSWGADIRVESTVGLGTTVELLLRIADSADVHAGT
jgi:nitrogen fixation/metabolism regulation signal transduction histidine kinase